MSGRSIFIEVDLLKEQIKMQPNFFSRVDPLKFWRRNRNFQSHPKNVFITLRTEIKRVLDPYLSRGDP